MTTPVYKPGGRYVVSETTSRGVTHRYELKAPSTRQLAFPVDLGPSHTAQQYTAAGRLAELAGGPGYWTTTSVTITQAGG